MYELNERFFRTLRLTRGKLNLPPRRGKTLGDVTMKMVKKILLLGTLAIAASLTLASCGVKEDEEKAIKKSGKIELTHNGSKKYYRSFAATDTKHYSANAVITIEDAANYAPKDAEGKKLGVSAKAGFGFVFGLEESNKDKNIKKTVDGEEKKVTFYDFGVASVRWNAEKNTAEWYVSWCKNVPDTVFNYTDLRDFKDTSLVGAPEAIEEYIVDDGAGGWKVVSNLKLKDDGSLVAMIKTDAKEDGSYTVTLCDEEGNKITGTDTGTISNTLTGFTKKVDGVDKPSKLQKLIGRYITVYYKQSVTGTIKYLDVNGNLIPAEDYIVLE